MICRPTKLAGLCFCLLVTLVSGGCFSLIKETRVQRLQVVSTPPGAWLQQSDLQGQRFIGRAPLAIEKSYTVSKKRFRYWNWIWPAVFGGCVGGGAAVNETWGLALIGVCSPGLAASLIVDIVGTVKSGATVPVTAEMVQLSAHLDNYGRQEHTLQVPGAEKQIVFALRPVAALVPVPVVRPVPLPVPMPVPAPPVRPRPIEPRRGKGPIVAVFDVEDSASRFTEKVLYQLTDFLAAKLNEEGGYRVVPRNQLRERLVQEKKDSYKKCYDESCQIDLGKAVAAQKSLATKLLRVGETCAISATLYDLKTETAEKATSIRTSCSENALMEGLETIARRLRPAS